MSTNPGVNAVETIAFPAISAGAYRFPIERATGIAVIETKSFLQQSDSIQKVVFVCFNQKAHEVYKAAIGQAA